MRPPALIAFALACFTALPSMSAQDKKKPEKKMEPRVAVIVPLGVPVGKPAKVTIRGMLLDTAKDVKVLDGKGTAKIVSKGKANVPDKNPEQVGDTQVEVEITVVAEATGAVEIVVVTAAGETKPHKLLVETKLPLVKDKEPNDGFRQAQEVKLPVVVEGALDRPRDVDVIKFEGKAGQKVTFEVLAARHGSPLDSILTLYDDKGAQLAVNDDQKDTVDSRLDATLPGAGWYYLVLMDAHDSGSAVHVYRLVIK